ncbi:MAG: hypothetical protein WB554_14020 [Desulfomonilaceae bacterium]
MFSKLTLCVIVATLASVWAGIVGMEPGAGTPPGVTKFDDERGGVIGIELRLSI